MSTSKSQQDTLELQKRLKKRMIESGEWDRIGLIMQGKLAESGWMDEMSNRAKDLCAAQTTLNCAAIMTELAPQAEAGVPKDVKDDIIALISSFIEANSESR